MGHNKAPAHNQISQRFNEGKEAQMQTAPRYIATSAGVCLDRPSKAFALPQEAVDGRVSVIPAAMIAMRQRKPGGLERRTQMAVNNRREENLFQSMSPGKAAGLTPFARAKAKTGFTSPGLRSRAENGFRRNRFDDSTN